MLIDPAAFQGAGHQVATAVHQLKPNQMLNQHGQPRTFQGTTNASGRVVSVDWEWSSVAGTWVEVPKQIASAPQHELFDWERTPHYTSGGSQRWWQLPQLQHDSAGYYYMDGNVRHNTRPGA